MPVILSAARRVARGKWPVTDPTLVHSPLVAASRLFVYGVWTLALVPLQFFALKLRLPLAQRLPQLYHRICCRILNIRLEVIGRRSRVRPTLFVANHSSYLDIMVYGALIKGSFVTKAEVAKWPLFGMLAKLQRSVFVDRRVRSLLTQKDEIARRLTARDNLILFPEGTSNDGNQVLPFKSSLFVVADQQVRGNDLTVQPVSIAYTRLDGMPVGRHLRPFFAWYGDMDLLSHIWLLAGLGRFTVTVTFDKPVTLAQLGSRKALCQYCWQTVSTSHAEAITGRWPEGRGPRRARRWIRGRRPRRPAARAGSA